nr:unnamed protein product [Callosobruchus analis]
MFNLICIKYESKLVAQDDDGAALMAAFFKSSKTTHALDMHVQRRFSKVAPMRWKYKQSGLYRKQTRNAKLAITYSATNSRGVQVEKSALGIHFLFMGVSKVTGSMAVTSELAVYIVCFCWNFYIILDLAYQHDLMRLLLLNLMYQIAFVRLLLLDLAIQLDLVRLLHQHYRLQH